MSPNNNEVRIYAKKGGKWEVEHVLKEVSTQRVTQQMAACSSPSLCLLTARTDSDWNGLGPQK